MQDSTKTVTEAICTSIAGKTEDQLLWQWDTRFNMALAQFSINDEDYIKSVLDNYLAISWDSESLNGAPQDISNILSRLGGLKGGQKFLTSSVEDNMEYVCCAWWPWGNGEKISIRIAPDWLGPADSSTIEDINQVKNWFGIFTG